MSHSSRHRHDNHYGKWVVLRHNRATAKQSNDLVEQAQCRRTSQTPRLSCIQAVIINGQTVIMFKCILDYERMAMNRDIPQPPYRLSHTLNVFRSPCKPIKPRLCIFDCTVVRPSIFNPALLLLFHWDNKHPRGSRPPMNVHNKKEKERNAVLCKCNKCE